MSNETENQNRQRIDKMQNDFEKSEIQRKANDRIQEANMKTLEATMRELVTDNRAASEKALAENRVALEKLRTGMFKAVAGGIVSSVTILGGFVAILAFVLRTPGGGG